MSLKVWAPDAGRVDVVTGEQRHPMTRVERGWWEAPGAAPHPDTDYAISLDGGPPLPDPRSQRLPSGVHGPSRRVDHAAFEWSDAGFAATPLASAIIYELHIGTFSLEGTFDGAIDRLEHLVDLGVTHVEIMPVHAFAGVHGWGYDVAGFFAPHEPYGGPDGLKRLVDACHARGLAVVLDVVYNHMGPEGCYLGQFGPYMTDRFKTPWGSAVNLGDAGADEVRRFIIDNALMWLRDYHVDGLRIDAVHAFIDLTASHLLEDMADAVAALAEQLGRALVLIAESDLNDPRIVRTREFGGYGLDAQWSDDFHHALHTTLTGESDGYYQDFVGVADLMRALEHGWVYEGQFSPHRGRRHGRSTAGLPFWRFVGFAQNHDQVGNRARGERLSHLVGDDELRIAAALLICGPFVPLLFQGEEWGAQTPFCYFADFEDEALRRAVREGRRSEFAAFGWRAEDIPDPMDPATFEVSRLDWEEPTQESHAALVGWYRTLIAIRASTRGLQGVERPELQAGGDGAWLDITCGDRRVAVNLAAEPHSIDIGPGMAIAAASRSTGVSLEDDQLTLAGTTAVVLTMAART